MSKRNIETIMLTWPEVSEAITTCVYAELGRSIICEALFLDDTYWSVQLKKTAYRPQKSIPSCPRPAFPSRTGRTPSPMRAGPLPGSGSCSASIFCPGS